MKISIAWIFDHINSNWQNINIDDFYQKFSSKIAEIDSLEKIETKLESEPIDYIITIDNKSFTHRPDLWGHRGIAREVAAVFNLELKNIDNFLQSTTEEISPIKVKVEDRIACPSFAGTYISNINNKPSDSFIASRLARVDAKSINFIIDCTNYVMLDLGQPMHAFDADKIETKNIVPRFAKSGETLNLLDGSKVELSSTDYVITDGKKPIALAGIMGGKDSAISPVTKNIFLESANFNASMIRKTATHLKHRTEASTRFEKSLDPHQNIQAILRFLKLANITNASKLESIEQKTKPTTITISHEFIINKLDNKLKLTSQEIISILAKLNFKVKLVNNIYEIEVPSFRATKDILLKEDITEEIIRIIGFDKIKPELPTRLMLPFDIKSNNLERKIKQYFAFSHAMHEVKNYAFYDEDFLNLINWHPKNSLKLANPFTTNIEKLVTSLIPNIINCIKTNCEKYDSLRFFEINKIWNLGKLHTNEQKTLSGIVYESKQTVDFYVNKAIIEELFELLNIDITFKKPDSNDNLEVWCNKNIAAIIKHDEIKLGMIAMIDTLFLKQITQGQAFIFEINLDAVSDITPKIKRFEKLKKYQETELDISMMIPLTVSVESVENIIKKSNNKITQTKLMDFYEKDEWKDQRSITVRFTIYDSTKTLTKDEIDKVYLDAKNSIESINGTIRC